MSEKICIVLRGVSGAGKTTFAEYLGHDVCSADDYFMKNGTYLFNPGDLGRAHNSCKWKFQELLKTGKDIVVSNTNVMRSDRDFYVNLARAAGYKVFSLIVERIHDNENVHGVPPDKVQSMADKLRNNLDL